MRAEHVVVRNDEHGGTEFVCQHCDGKVGVRHPIRMDEWVAVSEAFLTRHEDCPPKAKP